MSEEYAAIFKEEAAELLEELESALLELEEHPEDLKIVSRVFRAMHTIKGSGAMFGFDAIADFTHHVETVLDKVRDGSVPASNVLIGLILKSRDHICNLLAAETGDGTADLEYGEEIVKQLQELLDGAASESDLDELGLPLQVLEPPTSEASKKQDLAEQEARQPKSGKTLKHYRISFRPKTGFFETGGDVDAILFELQELGELEVTGRSKGTFAQFESGEVLAYWDMLLHSAYDENAVRDVFIFAENTSDIQIVELGDDGEESFPMHQRLGDILIDRGEIDKGQLDVVLKEQKPIGQLLVEKEILTSDKIESALNEQKILSKRRELRSKQTDSLRVAADKLDHLINLVGEMVVVQARLTDVANRSDDSELLEPAEEVERLTAELRDCVLNIRMLPIGSTFSRFKRLVRDLSVELGKEVNLVTLGAETEMDKGVIELMGDPLVHLIRNSIDHGIEDPKTRVALGKPAKGTITLEAVHSGANVIVQISDDGKGLDSASIRARAIKERIITSDAELSQTEIFDLVFDAGVSTAAKVTEVSGRGVGMDVVKNTVEGRLKGTVSINSEVGKGTTVSITLPLTLAIIDGLLVKAGDTHFVLPLAQVEECVELTHEDIKRFHGRHVYSVREQLVPYVILREFFQLPGSSPDIQQMAIVNVNGERVGFVLDDVVGGHQTVIKSLGWVYRDAQGISGATILGNGEVALIVDVANLIKNVHLEEVQQIG